MLNIPIVFENNDYLILDKPFGLTVNRSETTKNQETLQDWLEKKSKIQNPKSKINKEEDFYKRSGIVHRLDKDTSGLLVVAKNPQVFACLQRQFKEHLVHKTYLALVWGKLTENGVVNAPITRNPYNRLRFGVFVGGKEAQTNFCVIKNYLINNQPVSLLEVSPITGRTHQIRVHLNYLGFPLVGDPLYSGKKLSKLGLSLFGRLMLHAFRISFLSPKDSQRVGYRTTIPKEFGSLKNK